MHGTDGDRFGNVEATLFQALPSEHWNSAEALLSDQESADGWISLFGGQSLYGWRAVVDCDWRVESGTVAVSSGPVGLLRTTTQFADYHLRLEYRADPETNSGVFLHTNPKNDGLRKPDP